jgi:hypothetical protein
MSAARALASAARRLRARVAEYRVLGLVGFLAATAGAAAGFFMDSAAAGVCAPAGTGAILTSPASARGPIQKNGLLFTWLIRKRRIMSLTHGILE